jgi:hypothetical protein
MPVLLPVVLAGVLQAAPEPARTDVPSPDRAPERAGRVRRLEFDPDEITGHLARPEGTVVPGRTRRKHPSLIRVREHFVPEILASAEDV